MCEKGHCTFRVFLYFSRSRRRYGTLSSLVALYYSKNFLISPENQAKRATKSTSAGTPTVEAQ